jgi:transposase InsO family protein
VKFSFIHAEKAFFSIAALCRLLGVTRQGYYAFAKCPASARVDDEVALQQRIKELHAESRGTYGSPRMWHALRAEGWRICKRTVERAMRGLGLQGRMPRRWRATTQQNPSHPVAPNILARGFTATRPDERWVTDISYVWTDEGWCYLAVILDLFSRAVVGWALGTTLTTKLPLVALDMAVKHRRPGRGLLHHSDRGCQYTSSDYRDALAELGIVVSMSRTGNCWDNAVAESFFATIKTELVFNHRWATRTDLRAAVFEYIEVFYNRRRLHSSLGYKTPAQVESNYALARAA